MLIFVLCADGFLQGLI